MDIGQTFLLSVYSENILSTVLVQHLSQKTSYTEFHAPSPPPPLHLSAWISIIAALVSECFCGRLSLRKCHRSEATKDNFGWLIAGGSQVIKFTSYASWCHQSWILWGASATEWYRARPQTARARIWSLVGGVISFISQSSGDFPGQV